MTILTAEPTTTDPANLVDVKLFERLVTQIVQDESVDSNQAERIMRQSLVFLKACADNPTVPLSPTKAIDIGWHTFILHTADYAQFCHRIAGRFIHHNPIRTDDIRSGTALARTVDLAQATGYPLDMELWTVDSAKCDNENKCSQCHAGCYDSP